MSKRSRSPAAHTDSTSDAVHAPSRLMLYFRYVRSLKVFHDVRTCFAVALMARLVLVVYGSWQDASMAVKYTDVDYNVFTDASRHVLQGHSPYERATFRYTPLLAWLLLPSAVLFVWGKMLFVLCDLVVGWMLLDIMQRVSERASSIVRVPNRSSSSSSSGTQRIDALFLVAVCWLFNPVVVNVSTRGNAEALVAAAVVASLYFLQRKQWTAAGMCLGLSIHLKIYPAIYAPAMFFWTIAQRDSTIASPAGGVAGTRHGGLSTFLRRFYSFVRTMVVSALKSGPPRTLWISATVVFALLTGFFYYIYGYEFLFHSYLYHVTRTDNRHNFSLYFYSLYLGAAGVGTESTGLARLTSLGAFLPQIGLVGLASVNLFENLGLCLFVQTVVFVAFNKVSTVQYFVWYIVLLPLALASSPKMLAPERWVPLLAAWLISQVLWLSQGYRLEFLGEDAFLHVWLASIAFFAVQLAIVVAFLKSHEFPTTAEADKDKKKK